MIAVDTNLLVYAHRRDSEWHTPAARLVRTLAEGAAPWALPWPCLHEFIAIATHPRIYSPPSALAEAIEQVDAWLEAPGVSLLGETPMHWETLRRVALAGQVVGPRIHDARVAALCVSHGVTELWTADRDFSRYPGLVVRNPLIQA